MATYEEINSIVDAIISRITTNITKLGGTSGTPVTEGDELPERITVFPSIFVVPLIGDGDRITTKMSNTPRFHEFPVTIAGVYRAVSVSESLRKTRQYGYEAVDLFTGPGNQKVVGTKGQAVCIDPVMTPGYYRVGNWFIHTWSVRMTVKTITK